MSRFVIDASVAVKWLIEEDGSSEALDLLKRHRMASPDLLIAECANVLWKKVKRAELSAEEAIVAVRLLQRADIEILPTRNLMDRALELAITVDHAAYDCVYLALAVERNWPLVTADDRLRRIVGAAKGVQLHGHVLSIREALAR